MAMPSASGLDRAFACPPSAVLPQTRSSGAAAELGTAVHEYVEKVRARAEELARPAGLLECLPYAAALAHARIEALAAIKPDAEYLPMCEGIDLATIPRGAESEVTLAWDPATGEGRILGRNLGRDYSAARPGEIVGTADLVGRLGDDGVFVADWKTGRKQGPAAEAWQLRFLALAAARAVGARRAEVMLLYPRSDGNTYPDRGSYDGLDLGGFAASLRGLVEDIARARATLARGEQPTVSTGPWCRYCGALPSCHGQAGLIRRVLARAVTETDEEIVRANTMALSPAQVGEAYALWEAMDVYLKRVRDAMDSYARQSGGVPLPDGRVLREVVTTRRYLDGRVALKVLSEKHPELTEDAVDMEPTTSAAAIRRALVKQGRKAKEAEAILEEIGAADGWNVRTSSPVKPVRPGELDVPGEEQQQPRARRRA